MIHGDHLLGAGFNMFQALLLVTNHPKNSMTRIAVGWTCHLEGWAWPQCLVGAVRALAVGILPRKQCKQPDFPMVFLTHLS